MVALLLERLNDLVSTQRNDSAFGKYFEGSGRFCWQVSETPIRVREFF